MRENSNILLSYSLIFSAKIQISNLASFQSKVQLEFYLTVLNKQIHVVHNRRNSIKKIKRVEIVEMQNMICFLDCTPFLHLYLKSITRSKSLQMHDVTTNLVFKSLH